MDEHELLDERHQKDEFFKKHPQSPLSAAQKSAFNGLRYYPPNPALALVVTVTPFAEQKTVPVQTTTGDVRQYTRYGEFTFEVAGQTARLTVYATPHGYFLPFTDAHRGGDTYGAGRYLDIERQRDGRFEVDFNRAYNPYCAYNARWSCPITPAENHLKIALLAGEMTPQGHWVGHE